MTDYDPGYDGQAVHDAAHKLAAYGFADLARVVLGLAAIQGRTARELEQAVGRECNALCKDIEQDRDELTRELEQARQQLAAIPAAPVPAPAEEWRHYTVHVLDGPHDADMLVLCRSDDVCEDVLHSEDGCHLTLGAAVDWARSHVAAHAVGDAAPVVVEPADVQQDGGA